MNFEVGKTYKTRGDGTKEPAEIFRVICTDAPGTHPVIAVAVKVRREQVEADVRTYTRDGFYVIGGEDSFDLVAEDREPRQIWIEFGDAAGRIIAWRETPPDRDGFTHFREVLP